MIVYLLKKRIIVIFVFVFRIYLIMEVHQKLKKVAEESLTLQDCKFILSKIGDKQSKILFGNYHRKYHPKNCSLTFHFNRKLLEYIKMMGPQMKKNNKHTSIKNSKTSQQIKLPIIEIQKDQTLQNKLWKIIEMTDKQNIINKGLKFPKIKQK